MSVDRLRADFPITTERAYLIVGAIAPAARSVVARTEEWIQRWTTRPLENFEAWGTEVDELRSGFARLIGADASEIAITDGTSRAANIAIDILAAHPGSRVLVDPTTYPSSLYPWLSKTDKALTVSGVELTSADWPLAAEGDLAATCVSHVAWRTGHRHDLADLSRKTHQGGGLLMVDVAQSAGCVPIDVHRDGVDVLVGTTMKWLLGPPGIGYLYVRGDLLAGYRPRDIGYVGVAVDQETWPPSPFVEALPGARRLELGVPNLLGVPAARAGLDLVAATSVDAIAHHAADLTGLCISQLLDLGVDVRTPADPAARAGVVALHTPDAVGLASHLRHRRIDVMGFPSGLLRIDAAGFNTRDEMSTAVDEIGGWIARRST
jgi:cysteine desulfurase / selenocysteine lyase